jgi:hypothetical protein
MELLLTLFKSGLSMEEMGVVSEKSKNQWLHVKGLLQKYYLKDEVTGHVGSVMIFDSKENLQSFLDSEFAKSAVVLYKSLEPPTTRVLQILRVLNIKKVTTEV